MPRWRPLPEELDPQIHEFASQLRRLVDRSGLSIAAIADRTGYSKSSWERYLNGRLLPPRGATQALAEVTETDVRHLGTMWELAERAWSRSEMRHDVTMEAIRVAQARAALGEFGQEGDPATRDGKGAKGLKAKKRGLRREKPNRAQDAEAGQQSGGPAWARAAERPAPAAPSEPLDGERAGRTEQPDQPEPREKRDRQEKQDRVVRDAGPAKPAGPARLSKEGDSPGSSADADAPATRPLPEAAETPGPRETPEAPDPADVPATRALPEAQAEETAVLRPAALRKQAGQGRTGTAAGSGADPGSAPVWPEPARHEEEQPAQRPPRNAASWPVAQPRTGTDEAAGHGPQRVDLASWGAGGKEAATRRAPQDDVTGVVGAVGPAKKEAKGGKGAQGAQAARGTHAARAAHAAPSGSGPGTGTGTGTGPATGNSTTTGQARRAAAGGGAGQSAGQGAGRGPGGGKGGPGGGDAGRRRVTMFLAGVVGALVLAAAAVLLFNVAGGDGDKPKPQPTVAKKLPKGVKCQGASCAGKDPENMGCGGEHAKTSSSSYVGGSFVEVRYSKVCRAGWARVTGAGQGDSVKVTAGKRSETGAVGTGNDAYTAMVPAKSEAAVRACVTGSGGTRGCTTPGTTSPSGQ